MGTVLTSVLLFTLNNDAILILAASILLVIGLFMSLSGIVLKKKIRTYGGALLFIVCSGIVVIQLRKDAEAKMAEREEVRAEAPSSPKGRNWRNLPPYNDLGQLQVIGLDEVGSERHHTFSYETGEFEVSSAGHTYFGNWVNRAVVPQSTTEEGPMIALLLGSATKKDSLINVRVIHGYQTTTIHPIVVPDSPQWANVSTLEDIQKIDSLAYRYLQGNLENGKLHDGKEAVNAIRASIRKYKDQKASIKTS